MGLFDFLSGNTETKLKSLQKKVTERYGPPEGRQKVIEQLLEMGTPASIGTLLMRFTVSSEPTITDAEEKTHVYQSIIDLGPVAVEPLKGFLRRSELASSWALKMLKELVPEDAFIATVLENLAALGNEYTRDPQKKAVLIEVLGPLSDERIVPGLLPFLEDPADEIRIAAARALALQKDERSREPLCAALVESQERARVVAALASALADAELTVQGYREKIEAALPAGYYVDRPGNVRRRE